MGNNRAAIQQTAQQTTGDQQARAASPTIWEYSLGRQLYQARAAYLEALTQIPTGLGRLAYLAILQQRLLEDHEELFNEWLNCSLQQKYEWLYRLLATSSRSGSLPDEWLCPSVYADLVPVSAEEPTQALHVSEIRAVLEILKRELDGLQKDRQPKDELPIQTLGKHGI
jgi:hypothetical protein